EVARGNSQQNIIYCTKKEDRVDGTWRFGRFGMQLIFTDRREWKTNMIILVGERGT
ncbi:7833_t:CDS:2, partial [Ambispora gerdemannii]